MLHFVHIVYVHLIYILKSKNMFTIVCSRGFLLPRHCIPWFHAPHKSDPQWSQNGNNRYVWATNRCRTVILNLFHDTKTIHISRITKLVVLLTSKQVWTLRHVVSTDTLQWLCITHVHSKIRGKNFFLILIKKIRTCKRAPKLEFTSEAYFFRPYKMH